MEQLIEAFGIDVRLIVVQILNFVVLAAALSYFLYKPVLKILREREEKITQGIKDAEMAAQAKDAASKEKQNIVTKAHAEAETIAENAKSYAQTKADEIVATAKEKAAGVLEDASTKSEEIKAQAKKESEDEIAKIAMLTAEKILREQRS